MLDYCSLNINLPIVDLNKNILAPFIASLVRPPGKTKLNDETTMYCSPDSSKFFGTPCISHF